MRPASSDTKDPPSPYDHSNDPDNDLNDSFDPRPASDISEKPSVLKKIYASIADSFICKKINDFFGWIGGGVLAAADHVAAAFGRRQIVGEVVAKNIKDDVQPSLMNLETASKAEGGTIKKINSASQSPKLEVGPDIDANNDSISSTSLKDAKSENDADEQAFAYWLGKYKENPDSASCQQNFEARAKRVAQKIYDTESDRYAQAKQQHDTYWLSNDDQIRLKAAAALLKKNLPYSNKSSASKIDDPPTYHPDHQHNFSVWRTWIEKKEWPDRGLPDLKPALIYAKDFIRSHAESPDKHDDKTKLELAAAFQLVAFENDYALQEINSSAVPIMSELLKAAESSRDEYPISRGEPPPPPPRRPKVDYGPPPPPSPRVTADSAKTAEILSPLRVTSLPDFPNDAKSLQLLPIQATYTVVELHTIIINAKTYFKALKKGRQFSVESKAGASTLANLWKLAKSDGVKMAKLEQLEFFNDLDQLLQPEKIEKDFQ
jgi:hypothetical protein